jgi:hypothetical protein
MEPSMVARKPPPAGPTAGDQFAGLASAAERLLAALQAYERIGAAGGYARCGALDLQLLSLRQPFLDAEDALHALGYSYRLDDRPCGEDGAVIPFDQDLKSGIYMLREVLYDIRGGGVNPRPDPLHDDYVRPQGRPARLSIEADSRPSFAGEAARLGVAVEMLRRAIPAAAPRPQRRRRRQSPKKIAPLTSQQVEAMQLVAEHKGDISAAARFAGKSRQAMKKLYDKAAAKVGMKAAPKPKTQKLPEDRRGQANVPDQSGPRRRRNYEDEE